MDRDPGGTLRQQNPKIEMTKSADPAKSRWFIRPYVDMIVEGRLVRRKQRIYLGLVSEMNGREAERAKARIMDQINRGQLAPRVAGLFGAMLDEFLANFVDAPGNLAASTRAKYRSHIERHIRPAFGSLQVSDVTTRAIDLWLQAKAEAGVSWATRMDLRNIVSGIFTVAKRWGRWHGENPALHTTVGRRRAVREQRKLSVDETRRLLAALPGDVRLICQMALFCTLRISEVLGLTWRHIDFERGVVMVRQRYYRGDIDEAKSGRSIRDIPLGYLTAELAALYPGPQAADDFVFRVRTKYGYTRDDRSIHQHFLRKAAKQLGLYWPGFGFHAFRREAVTGIAAAAGAIQAMRAAGHSTMDVTLLYGLSDLRLQEAAIRAMQEALFSGGSIQ